MSDSCASWIGVFSHATASVHGGHGDADDEPSTRPEGPHLAQVEQSGHAGVDPHDAHQEQ